LVELEEVRASLIFMEASKATKAAAEAAAEEQATKEAAKRAAPASTEGEGEGEAGDRKRKRRSEGGGEGKRKRRSEREGEGGGEGKRKRRSEREREGEGDKCQIDLDDVVAVESCEDEGDESNRVMKRAAKGPTKTKKYGSAGKKRNNVVGKMIPALKKPAFK
jgi:hypothetical protein